MKFDLTLPNCTPTVLAGYLKGLAIHRLVAEQADPQARSYRDSQGVFHLISTLDAEDLVRFFLERYVPTPVVTPWNGGSGFFAGDQQAGIAAIAASDSPRFEPYRVVIAACRRLLRELGLEEKPEKEATKPRLLRRARAVLPDVALPWLDAAFVIGDSPRYAPLLGTGGIDGHLDFANNFMQRLAELLLPSGPVGSSNRPRLTAALLGGSVPGALDSVKGGQFAPALAGGSNMTAGFDAEGRVNPWDFVLTLEGAIFFAGASVRRLDAGAFGSASFPFHVRASAVGYGSSADADEGGARSELWLPLWPHPASCPELRLLFAEGRIDVDRRRARSGLDAARALACLGVDRGIDRFQRVAFLKRRGLAFLATTLGSFEVCADPRVELLSDLDGLLRGALGGIAATTAGLRTLRTAVFDAARQHRPLTGALAAAGALERAVSRSKKAREAVFRPSAMLSKEWLKAADDGSHEFALAAAVASWGVRGQLEPVDPVKLQWLSARPVWAGAGPLRGIVALALDRLRSAQHGNVPLEGRWSVSGEALMALLTGSLDRERLEDLIFGLSLVRMGPWTKPSLQESTEPPPSSFALLRAVTSPRFLVENGRHPATKVIPAILARLRARDLEGALRLATRRLAGSRCRIKATVRGIHGRLDFDALSAALVIPLSPRLEENLVSRVVERAHEEGD